MPKRIGETPPWLCRPSPGARIFSDPTPQAPPSPSKRTSTVIPQATDYYGPRRLIAQRGTEIFAAIGNKIRWAELARTRVQWEEDATKGSEPRPAYRTLSVPVYYPIRQLIISPSGHFLAICTDYTVQVAVVPDHSRLSEQDQSALKLKTYQLGPTTHVLPGSPLASVLWHPLANATTSTDCLVTVTAEAAVRVWELDRSNQFSFERPELAVDLRKLADGVSCDQDFEPSSFGKSRGFSVDDFDMEAAASCFGGRGADDEDAWASMTLWTAMKNGDVYALCPLLPSKWQPTTTTIPSLSTSAVSRMATIVAEDVDVDERRAADQQYEWVSEIDSDEPLPYDDASTESETRLRPLNPSAIPRLQGPFEIGVDEEDDIEITDIVVFPPRLDGDDLYSGEDEADDFGASGMPYTTILLAGSDGKVRIALDLDGVSGQWLPKKGRSTFSVPMAEPKELTTINTVDLGLERSFGSSDTATPFVSLTLDTVHRYTIFASVEWKLVSISLDEWITRMGMELSGEAEPDSRLQTRLETTCQNQVAFAETIVEAKDRLTEPLSAPAIIDDDDTGYLVLSSSSSSAYAAEFDRGQTHARSLRHSTSFAPSQSPLRQITNIDNQDSASSTDIPPSRAIYTPSRVFDNTAGLPLTQLKQRLPPPQKRILTEQPMRLSPALLDLMSSAHRTVSIQTAELETAAAELFRRCERLREELGEQVKQMSELADRLQHVRNCGEEDLRPGEKKVDQETRMERTKDKQRELNRRFEEVRRKVGKVGAGKRELSLKEKAWVEEVEGIGERVGVGLDSGDEGKERAKESLAARHETVKDLAQQLVAESKRLQDLQEQQHEDQLASSKASLVSSTSSGGGRRTSGFLVSSRHQKERIAEVMALVEREGAVIEAVTGRLERLKVDSGL